MLGEPYNIGKGTQKSLIVQYAKGRLEVSLIRGQVVLTAFYLERGDDLAGDVRVLDDLPAAAHGSPELFAELFAEWLSKEEIPFNEDPSRKAWTPVHAGVGGRQLAQSK